MTIRLVCITRNGTEGINPLLSLTELGGVNEQTGDFRFYNLAELHDVANQEGNNVYMTDILGNKLKVVPAVMPTGEKYIRSTFNNDKIDDILKLSSCKTLK
jgi:hypothetical protein